MLLIALILLATQRAMQAKANVRYDNFKTIATSPTTATYIPSTSPILLSDAKRIAAATAFNQPTATHNNWFLLQTTDNAAIDAVTAAKAEAIGTKSVNQQNSRIADATAVAVGERPHNLRLNSYATQINSHRRHQQLPLNYYTYNNNSSGNFNSIIKDVRFVAPYILAISNQRHQVISPSGIDNKDVLGSRSSSSSSSNNNNKNSNANNANRVLKQSQAATLFDWQEIESNSNQHNYNNSNSNNNDNDNGTHGLQANESIEDIQSIENGAVTLEDAEIDEVLLPLGKVLNNVNQFCELWKRIMKEIEAGLASSDLDTAAASTASTVSTAPEAIIPLGKTVAQLSTEVQGRRNLPPLVASTPPQSSLTTTTAAAAELFLWPTIATKITTMTATRPNAITAASTKRSAATVAASTAATTKSLTSAALAIGRGKKWKKKLKKFILPLLLAYKLKFFALVPLLIGGLTLLVGSTGLAGFFFALFITAMSLKSGGNKSVVIKKDW